MSLKIMAMIWEHRNIDDPVEKLVMLNLADFANDDGHCWPSIPTVAFKCSITEGACSNIIKRMEGRGFLTVLRRRGRGHTNTFNLHPTRGRKAEKKRSVPELDEDSDEDLNDNLNDDLEPGATDESAEEADNTVDENVEQPEIKPIPKKGFEKGDLEENPLQKTLLQTVKPPLEKGFLSTAYKDKPSVVQPPIEPSEREARENAPPPALSPAPSNPRAAFVEGTDDSRFSSPHYLAVCRACQRGPDGITWKMRAKMAGVAVELEAAGYSPADIDLAAKRWPRPIAPTPEQLQDDIKPLLNQKAANHATNQPPSYTPARVANDAAALRRFVGQRADSNAAGSNAAANSNAAGPAGHEAGRLLPGGE